MFPSPFFSKFPSSDLYYITAGMSDDWWNIGINTFLHLQFALNYNEVKPRPPLRLLKHFYFQHVHDVIAHEHTQ